MLVRFTDGGKAGEVAEIDDDLAFTFLVSGKAERVEPEVETPEKPTRARRKAVEKPETR